MQQLENNQTLVGVAAQVARPTLLQTLQSRKIFLFSFLLVAATLLLYGPVANHQFINFDDDQYVYNNPHVISGVSTENTVWAFSTLTMGHWHPLTWLSHMLDSQLFGINPAGHHYSSVLLHAANAFLLFFLLAKATGATWRSFLVAALFAVHPLNVESVAWVAERKTLLSAFFCFLMFAAYWWYAKATNWYRYLVVVATFVLALMAKAMAVTMPVALLLLDYWLLNRFLPFSSVESQTRAVWARSAAKLLAEKIPLFILSAVSSYLAVIAQRASGTLDTALPLTFRLKNVVVAYVAYIQKAFWPARLSIFYPRPETAIPWGKVILAFLVLSAISALTVKLSTRRYITAGWLYFLITLVPVIGIVQVGAQSMADRYAYTPLIGIFIVVVWGAEEVSRRLRTARIPLAAVTICVLFALGLATRSTLRNWQNSLTLFTHAEHVAIQPDKIIETNLGEAYNSDGNPEEGFRHFKIALAIDPHCGLAHYNVGNYLLQHHRTRESVDAFQLAIQYPTSPKISEFSRHNLGSAYLLLGEYAEAERAYTSALQMDATAYRSLIGRGQAFYADGKFQDAANDFSQALTIASGPQLFIWQAKAFEGQQRFDRALSAYTAALQFAPDSIEIQSRIADLQKKVKGANPPSSQ